MRMSVLRFFRPSLFLAILAAGRAEASSIEVLEPSMRGPSPSIEELDAATAVAAPDVEPGAPAEPLSMSVSVLGEPAVADEITAAVAEKAESEALPLRGSLIIEAFADAYRELPGNRAGPVSRP
jgi:hypothetical protein